jgi:hypothetical protein
VVEQVSVGQRVIVRVDALPGREFSGVVKFKAVLPDQNTRWANPNLRVYRTEIEIQNPVAEMRPGMSCSVEVLVADLENAIHVPVQAIFLRGGETVAFVDGAEGIEVRPVHVGRHNTAWVEIVEGLEEGELVLLSQPGGFELDAALEDEEEEPLTPAAEGAPGPASLPPGLPGGMPGGREGGDRGTFPGSAPGNGGRSGAEGSSRGRGDGEGAAAVERGSDSAERGSSPEDGPRGGRSGGEAAAGERAPSGGAEESRAERPR